MYNYNFFEKKKVHYLDHENQPEFYIMNPVTQAFERLLPQSSNPNYHGKLD